MTFGSDTLKNDSNDNTATANAEDMTKTETIEQVMITLPHCRSNGVQAKDKDRWVEIIIITFILLKLSTTLLILSNTDQNQTDKRQQ